MLTTLLGVVGATVFASAALWALTPTQRRRAAALGAPAWMPFVLIAVGIAYAWGAWIESIVPMVIGVLLIFPANALLRRRQRGREIPPRLADLQELTNNPLRAFTHPSTHARKLVQALGHPLRNKRETDRWYEERGL